jgi:nanoRNase/pAp phosphatase (c-di-AMP/oligoRNAs hydrolase)
MPVVNCPYSYASDVAGILAADARIEAYPGHETQLKVAAYYFDNHAAGVRSWGLRSTEDGPDVAKLAEKNRGGGHKHAAGFRTELP